MSGIAAKFAYLDDNSAFHKLEKYVKNYNETFEYCKDSYTVFDDHYYKIIRILEELLHVPESDRYVPDTNFDDFEFDSVELSDFYRNIRDPRVALTVIDKKCESINEFEGYIIRKRTEICHHMYDLGDRAGEDVRTVGAARRFLERYGSQ